MPLRRRDFIKMCMAAGACAALNLRFFRHVGEASSTEEALERAIRSTCSPNCTGACGFLVQVSEGHIATLIQSPFEEVYAQSN